MISLCNSEEFTVREFDFFRFSPEETKPELSEEAKDINFPDFNNDNSNLDNEPDNNLDFNIKEVDERSEVLNHLESVLEEERRKIAEIKEEAERIISDAKMQADEILKNAESEAVEIRQQAHSEGMDEGYKDGFNEAFEKNKAELEAQTVNYMLELRDLINEFKQIKDKLISQNIDELKDVTVSIAEKVIHVSLKTSGEIIKKMIISATEKIRYKEWARIYISKSDSSLLIEGNTDLLKAISSLSENIKITAMDDAAPGTCIIELPDQVIDASASTQIENIRSVLKGVDINGGNSIV